MKNLLLFLALAVGSRCWGQNLVLNGNFQAELATSWQGFNHQILTDDLIPSRVGNVNHGEGSLYQVLNLEPGQTYTVAFDYRWVSGSGGYVMNVRAKDEHSATVLGSLALDTTPDEWRYGTFSFTVPAGITAVRLVFYKQGGNRPLRIDNVYLAPTVIASFFVDPETPVNAQPLGVPGAWELDFSDEFNGAGFNPAKWTVSVSNTSRAPRPNLGVEDWWWVADNAFLDGEGYLHLSGSKVDENTMYCGSVESRDLYEPTYGYLEARIRIAETAKGNHTAFWLQGHDMGNVDNSAADGAEVDIFESAWLADHTKAVVHFDGYGANKKNHTIPYDTPGLHDGFHVFGLHWTPDMMRVYYDGVPVESTNPDKPFPFTTDPNGYPLVPQAPEWLWLSVGASFGDGDFQSQPVGPLSDALVDYVRVYNPTQLTETDDDTPTGQATRIYPNPARELVYVDSPQSSYHLKIFDVHGRLMLEDRRAYRTAVDLSTLTKGIYLIQIETADMRHCQRVVVY